MFFYFGGIYKQIGATCFSIIFPQTAILLTVCEEQLAETNWENRKKDCGAHHKIYLIDINQITLYFDQAFLYG